MQEKHIHLFGIPSEFLIDNEDSVHFATNLWGLLIIRVLHGITFGILTTVKGTICAELIPSSRRVEGISYFSMAMSLAMVFGPQYINLL